MNKPNGPGHRPANLPTSNKHGQPGKSSQGPSQHAQPAGAAHLASTRAPAVSQSGGGGSTTSGTVGPKQPAAEKQQAAHLQNAHNRTHAPEARKQAEHVEKALGTPSEKPKLAPHVEAAIRATLEKKG